MTALPARLVLSQASRTDGNGLENRAAPVPISSGQVTSRRKRRPAAGRASPRRTIHQRITIMKNRFRSARMAVLAMGTFTLACGGSAPSSEPAAPAATEPVASTTLPTTDPIQNAMSAGPSSISSDAAILDWDLNVIREGANGWTCLPDRPDTPGNDP